MPKLTEEELQILKTPNNFLQEIKVLKKLYDLGFIDGVKTDYAGRLFAKAWITDKGKDYLTNKGKISNFLNTFEISIQLGIFNIKKK